MPKPKLKTISDKKTEINLEERVKALKKRINDFDDDMWQNAHMEDDQRQPLPSFLVPQSPEDCKNLFQTMSSNMNYEIPSPGESESLAVRTRAYMAAVIVNEYADMKDTIPDTYKEAQEYLKKHPESETDLNYSTINADQANMFVERNLSDLNGLYYPAMKGLYRSTGDDRDYQSSNFFFQPGMMEHISSEMFENGAPNSTYVDNLVEKTQVLNEYLRNNETFTAGGFKEFTDVKKEYDTFVREALGKDVLPEEKAKNKELYEKNQALFDLSKAVQDYDRAKTWDDADLDDKKKAVTAELKNYNQKCKDYVDAKLKKSEKSLDEVRAEWQATSKNKWWKKNSPEFDDLSAKMEGLQKDIQEGNLDKIKESKENVLKSAKTYLLHSISAKEGSPESKKIDAMFENGDEEAINSFINGKSTQVGKDRAKAVFKMVNLVKSREFDVKEPLKIEVGDLLPEMNKEKLSFSIMTAGGKKEERTKASTNEKVKTNDLSL